MLLSTTGRYTHTEVEVNYATRQYSQPPSGIGSRTHCFVGETCHLQANVRSLVSVVADVRQGRRQILHQLRSACFHLQWRAFGLISNMTRNITRQGSKSVDQHITSLYQLKWKMFPRPQSLQKPTDIYRGASLAVEFTVKTNHQKEKI